jgi:septum formation protein
MSIPLILASQSPSRRNVLEAAGISPVIRVSEVDEQAVVAHAAHSRGVAQSDLTCEERVSMLAKAKAQAVYRAYRTVADTAVAASGEQVTAYPLKAVEKGVRGGVEAPVADLSAERPDGPASGAAALDDRESTVTRDFSAYQVPTSVEPIGRTFDSNPGFTSLDLGPFIIGCDSMFLFEGVAFGKPHTPQVARERLRAMRGKSGELWTGHSLVDFASGKALSGASFAKVTFSNYSDHDIESYVASGEPLEVAGCFTLEGLGGAFIESVDGDPSGVLGLSLPLLRHMVVEMGAQWSDLWNVGLGAVAVNNMASGSALDGARASVSDADGSDDLKVFDDSDMYGDDVDRGGFGDPQGAEFGARSSDDPTSIVPPENNIHQPGDGWVECACGRRHWGLNGAAGVLLARRDPVSGEITHIVMQHRAAWSAEGGTWGVPGGALTSGENPIEGALRESHEEAGIDPADIEVVGTYREEHGPWAYTTVLAFEKPGHHVEPNVGDDESIEIEWVPVEQVPNLKLLTAFRSDWPRFAKRLKELSVAAD